MKSILFAGATLMIGAIIYGFADFQKTSRDKKFLEMYQDRKEVESVAPDQKMNSVPAESIDEKRLIDEKTQTPPSVNVKFAASKASLKEEQKVSKIRKSQKKKISTKIFSRAPIREEIIYIDSIPEKKSINHGPELKKQ